MDIKAKITEIVEKITKDESLKQDFKENPTKAIEKVAGVDLPDDVVNGAIAGVKAKMTGDAVSGGLGKLSGLFGGGDKTE
ncbi:MAG: hypothetical protein K5897_10265 [Eubacterium sp.]|nr:hypothetical protein [Eubacterium sp.]